jgi:hypothetical protein
MIAALLIVATLGPGEDPEPPPAMKVIASCDWYAVGYASQLQRDHLVLKSAAELVAAMPGLSDRSATPKAMQKLATEAAAKSLGVKAIDWKNQMLLVVTAGNQAGLGHRIEVVGLKRKDGALTVSWKHHEPKGGGKEDVETFLAQLVLVPAYKGKVVFEQVK